MNLGKIKNNIDKKVVILLFHRKKLHYHLKKLLLKVWIFKSLNLTFPIASNPLSKSRITPRRRKDTPNPANPTPISESIKKIKSLTKFISQL